MIDLLAAKRAGMAGRIYLKLYEAGPTGAPITKDDAIGPGGDRAADLAVALEVVARFVDDAILDEPGHDRGEPYYALTEGMRRRMDDGAAERLRAALAGGPASDLISLEAEIRTGQADAAPL